MLVAKSFKISKKLVWDAWLQVKSNGGAGGIDKESVDAFERNLKENLYKIWNRMSSGCYMPPPVRAVEIPKKAGGHRILGIPTVADRVAQMVVKMHLEPSLEPIFHKDSYGYRPGKSAHQAIEITKQRCWQFKWVVEFDIRGLFDNIDHELLLKALRRHCSDEWVLLYIKRWLYAPMVLPTGEPKGKMRGDPAGRSR